MYSIKKLTFCNKLLLRCFFTTGVTVLVSVFVFDCLSSLGIFAGCMNMNNNSLRHLNDMVHIQHKKPIAYWCYYSKFTNFCIYFFRIFVFSPFFHCSKSFVFVNIFQVKICFSFGLRDFCSHTLFPNCFLVSCKMRNVNLLNVDDDDDGAGDNEGVEDDDDWWQWLMMIMTDGDW